MTLEYIAAIIESCYNNGRVMTNDRKMDRDDFMQLARAANGDIMRATWYEEMQGGNPLLYFSGSVTTERFEIKKKGRYRVFELGDGGAVKLPYAMGVLRVVPVMSTDEQDDECEEYDMEDVYQRGELGMEASFGSHEMMDDLGEGFYVAIGNGGRVFGYPEAKAVETDYIKNDETLDVPEGPAWAIINMVLGPVLKVVGFPVDPTNDGNPNVSTIKNQLAAAPGVS
jgi:hypothetical protein